MAVMHEYYWMVVLGCLFGFIYAFGIGANDVANAFASTVASGSLTCKQAVLVASIFEFCGSYFLGAQVTSTIRSKIFNTKLYANEPEIIMLGMLTSLFTAMILLLIATYFGLPVSTTHTVVGCITGFSICAKGFDSIDWKVFRQIIISWVISPGVSGVVAFLFFGTIRMFIMRHENSYERAYYTFPLVLTAGIGIDLFYVLYKGANNQLNLTGKKAEVLSISFGVGAFCGLVWIFVVGPIAKRRVEQHMGGVSPHADLVAAASVKNIKVHDEEEVFSDEIMDTSAHDTEEGAVEPTPSVNVEKPREVDAEAEHTAEPEEPKSMFARMSKKFGDATYNQDLKTMSFHESKRAEVIWDEGEMFDRHTEQLFTYLQVFTACLNSFAHGANDVANAIAPIAAIVQIYQDGVVKSKSQVPKWILAYGGIGIVVGLLLYGYNVMKSLGYKMTILSPSRGACAELAASLFVVTASFLKIPVSSTQCICGAVVGVGLAGGHKNVEWWFFLKVCCGWVGVFFTAIFCSAGVFSFCAFSPSLSSPIGTYGPPPS
jgi:solute carrier family 20 (sodium-dependent phosphate transporter)